ncbi:DUF4174 domain-containing protein [Crocosphaera sp. XPORK-15E]|uniref:DUF4174 domain-containing protein n=1 Tax=Crocosphaera sp. XPORK-15E TaxID=3110247 RepID=UPI002B1F2A6C|nr:DUF4174 domain-containing protein [Crocosphaera sp. XPORK-15E]MEA5537333.1 DUF4174 domain-containing protein [Crocosphaera sp. XPORK-15E]
MYKKIWTLITILGLMGSNQPSVKAENDPLAPYRWQNRLLLVFAPKVKDDRLVTIKQKLAEARCEFDSRDLLLGVLTTDAPNIVGNETLSAYDVAALRAKYGIKSNQFAVILIGKDGQPKSQLSEVPELEQIFGRIDTMPMRQDEMANSSNSCKS